MCLRIDEKIIAVRAYEIWCYHQDTGQHLICDRLGNPRERTAQDDWLEAEAQVKSEMRQLNDWIK